LNFLGGYGEEPLPAQQNHFAPRLRQFKGKDEIKAKKDFCKNKGLEK
jgi:hypothetical protein